MSVGAVEELRSRKRTFDLQRRRTGIVKSFGRRLASESPRGTNPRCAVRGLWGFVELAVPGLIGWAFAVVFGIANPEVFPSDLGTDPWPPAGKVADAALHLMHNGTRRDEKYAAYRWPYR